jgi:hypothetical protein
LGSPPARRRSTKATKLAKIDKPISTEKMRNSSRLVTNSQFRTGRLHTRLVIHYGKYQKFGADSKITFEK